MLHAALEKQKQEANKLNESAIEYNMLKRDAETYRALYEGILEKLKEASVSAGLSSNNFRIVDFARSPPLPRRTEHSPQSGLRVRAGTGHPASAWLSCWKGWTTPSAPPNRPRSSLACLPWA